jgi:hypothetical protein
MVRFHEKAKTWMNSHSNLSEDEWASLMEEDTHHPYSEFPTTYASYAPPNSSPGPQYSAGMGIPDINVTGGAEEEVPCDRSYRDSLATN